MYRDISSEDKPTTGATRGHGSFNPNRVFDDGSLFMIEDEGTEREKLQRKTTDGEVIEMIKRTPDELAKQDIVRRDKLSITFQKARMLDKAAATLMAGASGVSMRGVIWVD
ncbi:hypothetical protein T484DRAFT_1756903 [Baffinella frigidus]|nr:hypothetical protein T484DRAFT_1756903 [Cryptophyta sp. CCMP2293]